MTTLNRVSVLWTGTPAVGGGISQFYFVSSASGFVSDLGDFFDDIKTRFPDALTWSCSNTGDQIDAETGALVGVWTDGTSWTLNATASGYWTAGAGCRVTWRTGGINRGRRVSGTTFMVPLYTNAYNNGFIEDSVRTNFQAAADALVAAQSGDFSIWSRPTQAGGDGTSNAVTSPSVPVEVTSLRSRRT